MAKAKTNNNEVSAALARHFQFRELKTDLRTEIIAGISTYLSLAYIVVLNPAILVNSGMDPSAVMFATVIASGFATLAMGIWAKLPFAVAPGIEMSSFFAFVVCGTLGLTWQQALGTVFWSGVLCIILTLLPVRQKIIDAIPNGLKTNIAVSVGVFVATIGFFLAKILAFKNGLPDFSVLGWANFASHEALVFYIGFAAAVVLSLKRFRFPGALLAALIIGAALCHVLGITAKKVPQFSPAMFGAVFKLDLFSVFTNRHFLSVLLIFFIIDFFGGIGKFIGLTSATTLQSNGEVKNIGKALYVDGAGTVLGSLTGTSSLIAFVESAVGIAAGGRTGIVAIICGVLLLASVVFTPLAGLVPAEAAAGILLYVGYILLPVRQFREDRKSFGHFDMAVGIAMGFVSLLTFGLDKAMLLGFWAYTLKQLAGRKGKVNPYLFATTIILTVSIVMQYARG